jgi:hypothetical protein
MILVYHNPKENVRDFVNKLRETHNDVQGRNLRFLTNEAEKNAVKVFSASYNSQLRKMYGDKYRVIPKPRGRKKNAGNEG